jgi:SpoIID/LytB domain protein
MPHVRICGLFAAGLFLFSCASRLPPPEVPAAPHPPGYPVTEEGALRAYYDGEVEKSILIFEELAGGGVDEALRIKKQLAFAYAETGAGVRAAELLEDILKENPGSGEARRELFTALCLAADTRKARELLPFSPATGDTLFYEALLCRDMGEDAAAAELLKKSLAAQAWRPVGWFFLGELLAASSVEQAEECYRKALQQDAGLTVALFPLGQVLFAQKRYAEAYEVFLRAKNSFPENPEINTRITQTLAMLPELAHTRKAAAEKRKRAAVPPRVVPAKDAHKLPRVRVGLAEGLASLSVKTGGAYTLLAGGKTLYAGRPLRELEIFAEADSLAVKDGDEKIVARPGEALALEYADGGDTTLVFDFVSEKGAFFAVSEDRAYRGSLEMRLAEGGITLINTLNIEEYLYSVIPSEMPASWPKEALKAQAIAARSYTLAHLGQYAQKGFDVYGSVLSAAYRGVGGEAASAAAAVDSSRGVFLAAGSDPLKAYYSANHGGYSEDSRAVWGGDDAFMAAVADKLIPARSAPLPLDELDRFIRERPASYGAVEKLHSAAAYRWEKWVSPGEIKNRVAAEGRLGDILKIVSRGRGISGRVREVEIIGTKGTLRVSGDRIRSRLGGLRSNLFSVRSKTGKDGRPEFFIFQGAGWGHGVGMDQSGAAGMAQAGYTAEEILAHYYPRARIAP